MDATVKRGSAMVIYRIYRSIQKSLGRPVNTLVFSFCISDLPMLLLLSGYLRANWNGLWSYPSYRLVSVLAASVWTLFGPHMIVKWMKILNHYCDVVDGIENSSNVASKTRDHEIGKRSRRNNLFCAAWVALILIILLLPSGRQALEQYFFHGFTDKHYWLFLICVAYIAYQTAWFFLFLLISWRVINKTIRNRSVMRSLLLNEGRSDSLSLIGDFMSKTAAYFSSGLMFFPIMYVLFIESGAFHPSTNVNTSILVFVLMGFYLLVVFLYLVKISHRTMDMAQSEKDEEIRKLTMTREKAGAAGEPAASGESLERLSELTQEYVIEQRIRYTAGLNINPLAKDQYVELVYGFVTSTFFPTIFGILLANIPK